MQRKQKHLPFCSRCLRFILGKLTLRYRVGAKVFTFTFLAFTASPYFIELFDGCIQNVWLIGKDTSFEVAPCVCFHSHSRAGEVGTSDVAYFHIDNDDFEMNSWAHYTLKVLNKIRISVEIIPEILPGFFGVDEPTPAPRAV